MKTHARLRSLSLAVVVAAPLLFAPLRASNAQSPAEINVARQTASDGLTAYNAGDYEKALRLFEQARALYPSGQILRMIGYCEMALQRWEKAADDLEAALAAKVGPVPADERKEVEGKQAEIEGHFAALTVTTKAPEGVLWIDGGNPRKLPLDKPVRVVEGPHRLLVTAPGHQEDLMDLKMEGGKHVQLALEPKPRTVAAEPLPTTLPPAPAPPALRKGWLPEQRKIGFGAIGLGAAFGGAALVTIIESAHYRSMAENDAKIHLNTYGNGCATGNYRLCAYDIEVTNREANLANTLRDVSIGLGVTAAVLGAAGATLVFYGPRPAEEMAAPAPRSARNSAPARLACGVTGPGLSCAGVF